MTIYSLVMKKKLVKWWILPYIWGNIPKLSNFQENFSIPPNFSFLSQIFGFTAWLTAKFFTAKWQFNSASFSEFGCEFRHLASLDSVLGARASV